MKRSNVRIAIQKEGRLREASLKFLKNLGVEVSAGAENSLIAPASDNIEIIFVRSGDIPEYIKSSVADFGIIGQNVLREQSSKLKTIKELGFGRCELVIAVPKKSNIKQVSHLEGERIATSYPSSLRKFLKQNSCSASIVNLQGSVEAAPKLGLADAICDLTQSGKTLKANHLRVLSKINSSQAVLVESRHQTSEAQNFINQKIENIK